MISSSLRIVLLALLGLLACAGCDPRASGAPAPSQKREKAAAALNLLGDWTKTWDGHAYEVWFRDDMTYGTQCGWRGTWSVRGRTLYVREWHGKDYSDYWDWSLTLDEAMKGAAKVSLDNDRERKAEGRAYEVTLRRR